MHWVPVNYIRAYMKEILNYFKKGIGLGAGLGVGFLGTSLVAVAVSTFNEGEILTAAKLNENFQALKTAVEAASASSGNYSVVDSGGTKLGTLTPRGILNTKGYEVSGLVSLYLDRYTGAYGAYSAANWITYHTSTDCSGFSYVTDIAKGTIWYIASSAKFYYIPMNSTAEQITIKAYKVGNACSSASTETIYAFKFIENDPAVTGFNPTSFIPPFKYSP
ncbi:hypothetical protein LEP1GSC061_0360 [Leptospira wolffii serovar Khorat str. Khorat-H2]|nr:hypothetical protein LEP1GSC061_0360 [Leptospira wolffii serovar Khorat str. Khorat-H2]